MGESLWQRAPPFQLAGSPSPQTVGLTFSIQVSGLKCRYEQFFLLQRSQTAGRGVGTNPPAFLSLPRQNETEGDVQHQTPGHRHWSRPALANLTHPLPPPWPAHPLAGLMASRAPGFSPLPALRGLQGAEQPPQASTRSAAWEPCLVSSCIWVQDPQLSPTVDPVSPTLVPCRTGLEHLCSKRNWPAR